MASPSGEPLDWATIQAIQADEDLLNGLHGSVVVTNSELARALHAWRREIESAPVVSSPLPAAVAVVRAASHHRRSRRSVWSRVASATRRFLRLGDQQ